MGAPWKLSRSQVRKGPWSGGGAIVWGGVRERFLGAQERSLKVGGFCPWNPGGCTTQEQVGGGVGEGSGLGAYWEGRGGAACPFRSWPLEGLGAASGSEVRCSAWRRGLGCCSGVATEPRAGRPLLPQTLSPGARKTLAGEAACFGCGFWVGGSSWL